jgi:hypothetical protein
VFSVRYELNISVYDTIYTYMSWGRAAIRVNDQVGFENENGNFIIPVPRVFLKFIHRLTNALNKIQSITNIKILHVSALGFHPQGVLEQRNINPKR